MGRCRATDRAQLPQWADAGLAAGHAGHAANAGDVGLRRGHDGASWRWQPGSRTVELSPALARKAGWLDALERRYQRREGVSDADLATVRKQIASIKPPSQIIAATVELEHVVSATERMRTMEV